MSGMKFNYEIRQANKNDIPMIMEYIGEDWREGHILSKDREFFEYEFLEPDGSVNIVIAINLTKNRIDGCLGYLKTSRNTETFDTWGSIWKVRKDSGNLLGLEILEYVKNIPGNRYYLGIGMNPDTSVKIHEKILKENVGKMNHWYCLAQRKKYQIAVVKHKNEKKNVSDSRSDVKMMTVEEFVSVFDVLSSNNRSVPQKNAEYYRYRYFDHPIYTYRIYGIYKNDLARAVFILREDHYEGYIAVRMVDYYGDEGCMESIGNVIQDLFSNHMVEYIDFYEYGFSDINIKKAGFCLLEEDDTNVIPNYFSPFVQKNIDIWVTSPVDNAKFVKGDGDQDRPVKRE